MRQDKINYEIYKKLDIAGTTVPMVAIDFIIRMYKAIILEKIKAGETVNIKGLGSFKMIKISGKDKKSFLPQLKGMTYKTKDYKKIHFKNYKSVINYLSDN